MFMQNLSLSPHFFKKSDGDIAIAFICPPVRHAISSKTIGQNPTKFGVCVAHMDGVCNGTFFLAQGPGERPKGQILNFNYKAVIFLPAHPASFAHNFVSWMQSFYFSKSQDAIVLQTCHYEL